MAGQEDTSRTAEPAEPGADGPQVPPSTAAAGGEGATPSQGSVKGIRQVFSGAAKSQAVIAAASPEESLRALVTESQALADYLSRQGNLSDDAQNGVQAYDSLVNAIAEAHENPTKDSWSGLMKAYRGATAITYPERAVNGRTIQHTLRRGPLDKRNRPLAIGVALFALAMGLEGFAVWLGETPAGISAELRTVCIALVQFLIPACWGGIGACTFVVKRLTDVLGQMSFDADRLRGDTTRIFLGAMIGAIVVVLFFPQYGKDITLGSATFGPATAAFLAGLGTKVVYGAFETLVESLAKRLSGAPSK